MATSPGTGSPPLSRAELTGVDRSRAWFRYTGATGVTVVGAVTGTVYRFAHTGALVSVDARDRRSVAMVPVLQQVPAPA